MKSACAVVPLVVFAILAGCGKNPANSPNSETGTVIVRARTREPGSFKRLRAAETTWDSLIVRIYADDMDTARHSFPVALSGILTQTIEHVPAGDDRTIEAWTVDTAGDTIHGKDSEVRGFLPNETITVNLILDPIKGSIVIDLIDAPTTVDSVYAAFIVDGGATYSTKIKESTKMFMSIDKIPYDAVGTLYIAGIDEDDGDTVGTAWKKEDYQFTAQNATVEASFINVGTVGLEVTFGTPKVTVVRGIMDSTDSLDDEQTTLDSLLIVSEIMFTAGSGTGSSLDYVEIFNPSPASVMLDTLVLDVSGSRKYVADVNIGQGDYFVVGNKATASAGWIDSGWVDDTCSLDLYSTTNWITLLRTREEADTLIDWVAYENDDNIQGWPDLSASAKTSIVLDSVPADAEYNNYGKNWREAVTEFTYDGATYKGTPGAAGR